MGQVQQVASDNRELAAAVVKRAVLDLDTERRCEICARPVNVCAAEFLLSDAPEDAELLHLWLAQQTAIDANQLRSYVRAKIQQGPKWRRAA